MSTVTQAPISPFNSLAAVTATGAGSSVSVARPESGFGLQVDVAGFSGATVLLEGTINGTEWRTLGTWTLGTNSTGDIVWVTGKPVAAVRANASSLTGSGTVSAWIAAG